jgi:hypothetical protein
MKKIIPIFSLIILASIVMLSCGQQKSDGNDFKIDNSQQNSNAIVKKVDTEASPYATVKEVNPNASPESVMNTIFKAANSGEVGILKFLLPPFDDQKGEIPCDGDCKALCNPGNESMKDELGHNYISLGDFKEYFSKGKIIGTPSITGDEAKVNFVFGPNLDQNETMNMQRINSKWYLSSF